jgi:hypothetical protein
MRLESERHSLANISFCEPRIFSSELLIEEFENVIFPSIDSHIDKIVSIIRAFAHCRINF